jgi:nicotinamide mononucleotide adenylyltransferase/ADP-ribose pyrophosphatase YjhB (NUDIX family)
MENDMVKQLGIGVIPGRFQLPHLHAGHLVLIDRVYDEFEELVILVGESNYRLNRRDPYPAELVIRRLKRRYPGITILPFRDSSIHPREWSHRLDEMMIKIADGRPVTLCGSRDSFSGLYFGSLPVKEYPQFGDYSATVERERLLSKGPPEDPALFDAYMLGWLHGVSSVYGSYPIMEQTVDVLVHLPDWSRVLMVRRMPGLPLRFPGGFRDQTDVSLEHAVLREGREELGSSIVLGEPQYVGSLLVSESRVRDTGLLIATILFAAPLVSGEVLLGDDMALGEYEWVDPEAHALPEIESAHQPLFELAVQYRQKQLTVV